MKTKAKKLPDRRTNVRACGCTGHRMGVKYCLMHGAAPEMLEALAELYEVTEEWNQDVRNPDVERLWEALREARYLLARMGHHFVTHDDGV